MNYLLFSSILRCLRAISKVMNSNIYIYPYLVIHVDKLVTGCGDGIGLKRKITTANNEYIKYILGDPEVTANIYCKSRHLPNRETRNYRTDFR